MTDKIETTSFEELRDRIDADDPRVKRGAARPQASAGRALVALAGIGLLGGGAYLLNGLRGEPEETLVTAEAADWQGTGDPFGAITAPAPPAAAPAEATPVPIAAEPSQGPVLPDGPSATERAMMETLEELRAELDALRQAPAEGDEADAQLAALTARVAELDGQAVDLREAARAAEAEARTQENATRLLRAQLEAAEAELEAARFGQEGVLPEAGGPGATVRSAEDAQLAALEARRAEAAALREARVTSPLIAFGGSASPGEADAGEAPDLGQDEAFLRAGARTADVEQAAVIANPSRTVVQGTAIQAALETAIDSSLPGAIRAVVSEDVHSFDGSRVLIPRGSKLIGRYNSQLEPTQRRLMVAWDRIITPDGQSVTISAYGADELGRSGTTGTIDRRLGTRFGSAVLVSLISALPSAAAASVEDPLAAELAEELGGDAEDAAGSVLDPYLSVAPTIRVDQGARITVIVDRDLELF